MACGCRLNNSNMLGGQGFALAVLNILAYVCIIFHRCLKYVCDWANWMNEIHLWIYRWISTIQPTSLHWKPPWICFVLVARRIHWGRWLIAGPLDCCLPSPCLSATLPAGFPKGKAALWEGYGICLNSCSWIRLFFRPCAMDGCRVSTRAMYGQEVKDSWDIDSCWKKSLNKQVQLTWMRTVKTCLVRKLFHQRFCSKVI